MMLSRVCMRAHVRVVCACVCMRACVLCCVCVHAGARHNKRGQKPLSLFLIAPQLKLTTRALLEQQLGLHACDPPPAPAR